jgi:hypothetical protein
LSTQEESEVRGSQSEVGSQCIGRQSIGENKVEHQRNPLEGFQDGDMMGAFDKLGGLPMIDGRNAKA